MGNGRFGWGILVPALVALIFGLGTGLAQDDGPEPQDTPKEKEKVSIETEKPTWREIWKEKKREKKDFRVHLLRGLLAQENGEFRNAIGHYQQAIKNAPQCAQAYVQRGVCEAQLGKTAEAVSSLLIAARIKPDLPSTYYHLGLVYVKQYRIESAEEQLAKLKPLDAKRAAELAEAIAAKKGALEEKPSSDK